MGNGFTNPGQSLAELNGRLTNRYRSPEGALFSAAVLRDNGEDLHLSSRVVFGDGPVSARGVADYGKLLLLEEWVPSVDLAFSRLERLLSGAWEVAGRSLSAPFREEWQSGVILGSPGGTLSGWNEWVLKGEAPYERRPKAPVGDPALAFGLPPFKSVGAAVNEWVWGERGDGRQDAMRLGEVYIAVPDTRGRIVTADWARPEVMHVELELNVPREEFELQAYFERSPTRDSRIAAPESRLTIPIPEDAGAVLLYLVHQSGERLGHMNLSAMSQRRSGEEERRTATLEERAKLDLRAGEGVEVEFKPFITPKNEKETEVVRTVVAFANTRGGNIYFGVLEKSGLLHGVTGLQAAYGKSPVKAREEFESHLRKLIGDKVRGFGLKFHLNFVELSGEPIGVLTVEPGEEPPYSTADDEVLVRKGSSNKRPDAQTELVELCGKRKAPGPILGDLFGRGLF